MTTDQALVLLIGGGGLLQIFGVLLVVKGIRTDRRLAEQALEPLLKTEHEPTYPEEFTEHDKATFELRDRLLEETIRPTRREARQRIEAYDAALRDFIRQQLTGDIGTRVWGVGLIVTGVVLTTIGGVWATVVSI